MAAPGLEAIDISGQGLPAWRSPFTGSAQWPIRDTLITSGHARSVPGRNVDQRSCWARPDWVARRMVRAPLAVARRHGGKPSISVSSEKLRNVLISTISPRTRTLSSAGATATVLIRSAATRTSSRAARYRRRPAAAWRSCGPRSRSGAAHAVRMRRPAHACAQAAAQGRHARSGSAPGSTIGEGDHPASRGSELRGVLGRLAGPVTPRPFRLVPLATLISQRPPARGQGTNDRKASGRRSRKHSDEGIGVRALRLFRGWAVTGMVVSGQRLACRGTGR